MLIYSSVKDHVTGDSYRRRVKLLNSQHRNLCFSLCDNLSWTLLSFCMPSLPSELQWCVCLLFLHHHDWFTWPWLYSSVLLTNIEPSLDLRVERTCAKSKVAWGYRGACNNWYQSKPHGDGDPSCQKGSRELVTRHTLQGIIPIGIKG